MSSNFYKISCIDEKKECNIIEPVSEHLNFEGINPVSGQKFIKDDITSVMKRYDSMCLNKSGLKTECCDPMESKFTIPDTLKEQYAGKKFKVNREFGIVNSIDMCDKNEKCEGDNWIDANPYLMCKIGNNTPQLRNNVLKFNSLSLKKDCYTQNCNSQGNEISFGNLISGSGKSTESTYITDLRLADNFKEDNIGAIKSFLENYQRKNKKTGVNYVLTDDDAGDTLLLRAIKNKAIKCVNLLLSNSADINSKAMDTGMTTLHYACMYGNEGMIANLINYGARTDVMDFKGRPPLFYAIMYGTYNMVMYLTNQNPAMLLVRDKYGNSPLHIATKYSNNSNEVVQFLLDNGVSSETKNNKGFTASQLASKRIKQIEIDEQKLNTEMFIEPFETIGKAEESKLSENKTIQNISSSITLLQKAHFNEHQNQYQGFIKPQDNLNGPVEFINFGCYPDATIENKEECLTKGHKWQLYNNEDMKTLVKVEYNNKTNNDNEDDEDEDEDENGEKEKYYKIIVKPIEEKQLPPLYHDSLMNISHTTPIPTPSGEPYPSMYPTNEPTQDTLPTQSSSSSSSFNYYYIIIAIIVIIVLITIGFVVYKFVIPRFFTQNTSITITNTSTNIKNT